MKIGYSGNYKKHLHETATIYALVDPRDGKYFYVGSTVNLKNRIYCHFRGLGNDKTKLVIDELNSLGLKPGYQILDTVPFSEKSYRERRWIAQCHKDGHPLKNIMGFDTYKGELFFTMKILPNKTGTHSVGVLVSDDTKEFIDRLACESVACTSDVVRHLIELGIKHFND